MIFQKEDDGAGAAGGKDLYAKRRDKLRRLIAARGLDALLVSQASNRFYLSGFELHDPQPNESAGMLVICADGADWLATDSRYTLAAEKLWPKERIFLYGGSPARQILDLLAGCGAVIGFESRGLSWNFAVELKKGRPNAFSPAFVPADGLVESLRIIKDDQEIAALKKSFQLNHAMLAWLEKRIEAEDMSGVTEKDLAWEIERFFREKGAQELAFASIVAYGANGAMPHAVPEAKKPEADTPLLADVGCRVCNYCSDQTRTWWLGPNPSQEFSRTFDLVRKAQNAALAVMKAGVSCAEAYKAAYKIFTDAGVEKAFTHGLGHGVGLETHEKPALSPRSREILRRGMVVTVEPGLYYPEWGGVRWENTVLVEEDGVTIL